MVLGINPVIRSNMMDEITALAAATAPVFSIYDGTQPATGGAPTTLLAQLTCGVTFANASSNGVLTLQAITTDSSANASGTATWFRIGTTGSTGHILDGTVAVSTGDLNLNSVSITVGGSVAVTSAVITAGNA